MRRLLLPCVAASVLVGCASQNAGPASWADAVATIQTRVGQEPDRPGVARALFDLVSAVLRAVFGGVAGLIEGVVTAI